MQKQVPLLIPYHLCRDVIGKCVASVLIGMQPPTIVDGLPMQQFVGLHLAKAMLQTFTLHIEEALETRKTLICLIDDAFQVAHLM